MNTWAFDYTNTAINQFTPGTETHNNPPISQHFSVGNKRTQVPIVNHMRSKTRVNRDLKITVLPHFSQTANVKKSHDQGLAVSFAVRDSHLYS